LFCFHSFLILLDAKLKNTSLFMLLGVEDVMEVS